MKASDCLFSKTWTSISSPVPVRRTTILATPVRFTSGHVGALHGFQNNPSVPNPGPLTWKELPCSMSLSRRGVALGQPRLVGR